MTWKNRKRLAMVRIQLRKTLKYLLHVGFTRRSKVRFAPAYFFACGRKIKHPPASLLLLFAKSHARRACSLASALTTARCRFLLRCPAPSAADSRLDDR